MELFNSVIVIETEKKQFKRLKNISYEAEIKLHNAS